MPHKETAAEKKLGPPEKAYNRLLGDLVEIKARLDAALEEYNLVAAASEALCSCGLRPQLELIPEK